MSDDEYNDFYGDNEQWNSSDDDRDSYDWENPEDNQQNEFAVFQRVGLPGETGLYLNKRNTPMRGIDRAMQDPLERFQEYVDSIARNLKSWEDVSIDNQDIETMFKKSRNLKNVGYKNPTAYILGYLASQGGKELNDPKSPGWINAMKALNHLDDSVLKPDIIRYARLWLSLSKSK